MRPFCCLLLLFLSALVSHARLGETEEGLIKLFGQPASRGREMASFEGRSYEIGTTMSFRQEDWSIRCVIIDDRCARVSYSKVGSWSEEQFRTTLNVNLQGLTWTLTSSERSKRTSRTWRRSDGAVATWNNFGPIIFTHPAYERARTVAAAKAKAAASKVPKL